MNRIRELRERDSITQAKLGAMLSVKDAAISKYESETVPLTADTIKQLCRIFNVSSDYLLGVTDTNSPFGLNQKSMRINEEVGNSLAYWIRKTGLSYEEVAEQIGVSENRLEDYCSGFFELSLEELEKLAKLCDVSTDCLLGLRQKSRPTGPDGNMLFRFDPEISRRLKSLAAYMGESYGAIADQFGIEENEVLNLFEYGFIPHISILTKLAEHFLVSSDYLLNLSNSTMTIKPDEEELLKTYRALTDKNKVRALSRLYDLEEGQSAVAATGRALDNQGKSLPSSGTEG